MVAVPARSLYPHAGNPHYDPAVDHYQQHIALKLELQTTELFPGTQLAAGSIHRE